MRWRAGRTDCRPDLGLEVLSALSAILVVWKLDDTGEEVTSGSPL